MSLKTSAIISLFLFFPELVFSQTFSTPSSTLLQKSYKIQWNTRYFQSHSTVDSKGIERIHPPGTYFNRWDNDIRLSYGLNERLEPEIGLRHRFNNSDNVLSSSHGMESFWFQVKYRIPFSSRFQLTAYTRFRQTIYSKNNNGNNMVLGDPGNESEWGGYLTWLASPKISASLYLGYRRPSNQLSEEIHYLLELLWQKKTYGLSLGIDGTASLETDPYPSESGRPQYVTGNTNLYNSFNRQWLKPHLALHYAFSPRWKIDLKGSQAIQVLSGDTGLEIGLRLSLISQGITLTQKKIRTFKEYSIEANVTDVSKKKFFVQIDQGLNADISKGMKFDIYEEGFAHDNKILASGIVWKVLSKKSIIRIFKRYTDKKIQPGAVARGY